MMIRSPRHGPTHPRIRPHHHYRPRRLLAQTFKLPSRFVLATVAALRLVGSSPNGTPSARHAAPADSAQARYWTLHKPSAAQSFALLVRAIRRDSRLAITMEARGWRQANAPGLVC